MQTIYYGFFGVILLGVILFFYFSSRKSYRDPSAALRYDSQKRNESIDHYKQIRDDLTLRELKEDKEEESNSWFNDPTGFIVGLVTLGIVLIIGIYIAGQVQDSLTPETAAANATATLIDTFVSGTQIISMVVVIGFGLIVILVLFVGLSGVRESAKNAN